MSYDVEMIINVGGQVPAVVAVIGNMTSNVGSMYVRAMPHRPGMLGRYGGYGEPEDRAGLTGLSGMTGEAALPILDEGVRYMRDHAEEMRALEPEDRWGTFEAAFEFLQDVRSACEEAPGATLTVSW